MGYFWAEGVIFASQFGESGFHISLSQQVLSAFFGKMLLHSLINKLVMTIKTTMVKRQRFHSSKSMLRYLPGMQTLSVPRSEQFSENIKLEETCDL